MEDKRWIDFKAVKAAVTLRMVLEHYGATNWKVGKGDEFRGPCLVPGCEGKRSFSWNPIKNIFQCFDCKARGNILDLVSKKEDCSVKDAASKLAEWFKVGDSSVAMNDAVNDAERPQVLLGIYEHFKGNRYLVTGVALHSETGEPLVIYRALYGDYILSARPVSMFTETVERGQYTGPRFKLIQPL